MCFNKIQLFEPLFFQICSGVLEKYILFYLLCFDRQIFFFLPLPCFLLILKDSLYCFKHYLRNCFLVNTCKPSNHWINHFHWKFQLFFKTFLLGAHLQKNHFAIAMRFSTWVLKQITNKHNITVFSFFFQLWWKL